MSRSALVFRLFALAVGLALVSVGLTAAWWPLGVVFAGACIVVAVLLIDTDPKPKQR